MSTRRNHVEIRKILQALSRNDTMGAICPSLPSTDSYDMPEKIVQLLHSPAECRVLNYNDTLSAASLRKLQDELERRWMQPCPLECPKGVILRMILMMAELLGLQLIIVMMVDLMQKHLKFYRVHSIKWLSLYRSQTQRKHMRRTCLKSSQQWQRKQMRTVTLTWECFWFKSINIGSW